jgi:hypothetical protein
MWALVWVLNAAVPGEIFGDVKSGDSYLPDAPVTLTCGTETVTAKTDSAGSFRLRAKATGKCRLAVTWKEQSPELDVVVFERPTRYRLLLEEKDGKFLLRRV